MGLFVPLLAAVTLEDARDEEDLPPQAGFLGHLKDLGEVILTQRKVLTTAGLGQMFAQMIRAGRQIVVPLFASDVLGLAPGAIGTIISISGFLDMAMFYPAGLVMDRFGRKFAVVPCFLVQGIGMGLIPLTSTFTGLLLATCLLGLGNGIGSGSMMTLGADLAPKGSVGAFLGVWRLIGDGGGTGAPLCVGAVADLLGLSAATLVTAAFGVLAAAIFASLVPETLRSEGG
jgi:MFS family permease